MKRIAWRFTVILGLVGIHAYCPPGLAQPTDASWSVPLTVSVGEVRSTVYLGVTSDATDQYDRDIDRLAPPPPPGGTYTYLSIDGIPGLTDKLSRDLRALDVSAHEWTLMVVGTSGMSGTLSWLTAGLPEGELAINGTNMLTESSIPFTGDQSFTIQYTSNQPPEAEAGGPYVGDEGSPVILDASGSNDPDEDSLQYRWDFDSDGTWDTEWSDSPSASYTWPDDWTGTATVEVSDGELADADEAEVTVRNVAPTVEAGADQTVDEGAAVSFTGSFTDPGSGDTHTLVWDFGDGSAPVTGTLEPTHVYADNGSYTVILTVTDDDNGESSDQLTVTVDNVAPMVDAGLDAVLDEGDTFTNSGSFSDPGTDTWSATVDYGNGTGEQPLVLTPDETFDLSHTYADDGVFTVTVTVTDDDGGEGMDIAIVTVNNVAPTVQAATDLTSIDEGDGVLFTGSFSDPGADTHTLVWDFGDGSDPVAGLLEPTHIYVDNGTFIATLTVTDDDGGVGSASVEITVANVAPTVEAGADQTVDEGDIVSFTGSFTDPGSGDTHTIVWDFGDGSDPVAGLLEPTHAYADNGIYTVTLTVTDDDGGQGVDQLTVTVLNVAPTVDAGLERTVDEGGTLVSTGSFADPGADTWSATVDYGDGTGVQALALTPDKTFALSHTYGDDGAFTVTVTVTDDDQGVGIGTTTLTVNNVAPILLTVNADQTLTAGDWTDFAATFTDPGWLDTHMATWDHGDETSASGTVTEENEAPDATGTVTGGHSYFRQGVYTVGLTVTDDDDGIGIGSFTVTVNAIAATIDFDPNTLNLSSGGNWVTVYIELPEGYDVRHIIHTPESPVLLNGVLPAVTDPKYGWVKSEDGYIVDHDGDGILERMVKFDKAEVQAMLEVGEEVVVTASGVLAYDNGHDTGQADFEGHDIIRAIDEGKKDKGKGSKKNLVPTEFVLLPNAPNPFNPKTSIEYGIPEEAQVRLVVYNAMGQRIRTLVDVYQPIGFHQVVWDGRDDGGQLVSGGVYFCRLQARYEGGEFSQVGRMLLVK